MWSLWLTLANAADPTAIEHQVHVLDNGLTVILAEDHNTDTIALHVHYDVGARDERPGEFGCAHLFEHLMFEGSGNVPGNAFDEWLGGAGGDNNAFTSSDETAYHEAFPSGALDLVLMLESDRMAFLDAALDQKNLENQQKVVLQERAEGFEQPGGRTWDAMDLIVWPQGHPYQHMVIGTIADVEGFTTEGVRDFWKRHYRPRNAVLALVGNFETDAALERVKHWFADVPDPGPAEPRAEAVPIDAAALAGDWMIEDRIEDRRLYLAYTTVPQDHPDSVALDVLAEVLFGGRGTRISDALYYDKSVFSSLAGYNYAMEIGGAFFVELHTEKWDLAKARKKYEKTFAKERVAPFTQAEIDRAVAVLRSGELGALETLENRAEKLVDCQRLEGVPTCSRSRIERYEAVTPADLTRVLSYFDAPPVTLSVIPNGSDGALPGATTVVLP